MIISGLQKTTLLDYPGKVACIIFTKGCNYNCKYCQNSGLISLEDGEKLEEEYVFDYLKKRRSILDGVVISGGEPTIWKDLKEFIIKIKSLGFKIKLDTNGTNYELLKELISEGLIDYVAMDIKNIFIEYEEVANTKNTKIDNIKKSINLLKENKIDHEFRTTIIKNYHDINKIIKICKYLGNEKYYLQKFICSDMVQDKTLISFEDKELSDMIAKINKEFPNVKVRGI